MNLVGSSCNTLDTKRRVAIPKKFRDQIEAAGSASAGQFVLCRQLGGDRCLALYLPGRFEAALAKLEELRSHSVGVGNKTVRGYLRRLRMSAAYIKPDRQSRVTLTEEQCRLAGITKEITFVGYGDHMELWAPEELQDDTNFRDLATDIFG